MHALPRVAAACAGHDAGPGRRGRQEKAQLVVLEYTAQHIQQQAGTASGPFLVGDFQSPAFEQVVEAHAEVRDELALHHAELVQKTQPPPHPRFLCGTASDLPAVPGLALIATRWLG